MSNEADIYKQLLVFAGTSHVLLAENIARFLKKDVSSSEVTRFNNGEVQVILNESVRGKEIFLVQTICSPVNDMLMELLIMIDALKRSSAHSVTVVMPYFAYSRQDQKQEIRDPIIAKLIANLISKAGADKLVTMDMHSAQLEGFFDIPVVNVSALDLLAQDILEKFNEHLDDIVIASPDMGGVSRARHVAEYLKCPMVILDKRRPKPDVAMVVDIVGETKDKTVILIDDTIDTAGSIIEGARVLKESGAKCIYAYSTHAVFSSDAIDQLEQSDIIKEVVVTDTLPFSEKYHQSKIRVITVASIFSVVIKKIVNKEPLKRLFI